MKVGAGWPAFKLRTLITAALALVVLLPLALAAILSMLGAELVRQTEERLLAEAAVVAEIERGLVGAKGVFERPDDRWRPIAPSIDPSTTRLEPAVRKGHTSTVTRGPVAELSRVLAYAQIRNLSAIAVVDVHGVVIASSGGEVGYELGHLPEVAAALAGNYAPVLRERRSTSPRPGRGSISRSAKVRVSLAVPIFEDPYATLGAGTRVLGAVYANRTPIETEEWLWARRPALAGLAAVVLASVALTLVFVARFITRPIARLRSAADAVAAGALDAAIRDGRRAPEEIEALALALAKMRDELVRRATYTRDFANNVVHELKTPLTSMRGAAELLLEAEMSPDRARRFLTNIQGDVARMEALVRRILELARIEVTPPERKEVDVEALAREIVGRLDAGRIRMTIALERKTRALDPAQLESMLQNLLENALRHSEGEPVDLTIGDQGGVLTIEVRDFGPTKPVEHFERIFERFYTTERARGGTGLGLSIVKAVAEAHGGTVEVARREPGAVFTVKIASS